MSSLSTVARCLPRNRAWGMTVAAVLVRISARMGYGSRESCVPPMIPTLVYRAFSPMIVYEEWSGDGCDIRWV